MERNGSLPNSVIKLNEKTKKTFEWCLKRKGPGLRRIERDIDRAKLHMEKARGNLEVLGYLEKGHYYDWVVISGYYSMYHAALAALLIKGYEGKDHNCVVVALRNLYLELEKDLDEMEKAYKLERNLIENLDRARVQRINIQYGITKVVSTNVDWIIPASRNFVNKIEEILYREISGSPGR